MKKFLLIACLSLLTSCSCASHRLESSSVVRVEALCADTSPEEFNQVMLALCLEEPLDSAVRVVVAPIAGPYLGLTQWDPLLQRFDIQLEARVPSYTLYDTLAHEWAHARTNRMPRADGVDHDAAWGVELAAAYRTILRVRRPPTPVLPIVPPPSAPVSPEGAAPGTPVDQTGG